MRRLLTEDILTPSTLKLHITKLHNLNPLPDVVTLIKRYLQAILKKP
jgi:hypothetical protein